MKQSYAICLNQQEGVRPHAWWEPGEQRKQWYRWDSVNRKVQVLSVNISWTQTWLMLESWRWDLGSSLRQGLPIPADLCLHLQASWAPRPPAWAHPPHPHGRTACNAPTDECMGQSYLPGTRGKQGLPSSCQLVSHEHFQFSKPIST